MVTNALIKLVKRSGVVIARFKDGIHSLLCRIHRGAFGVSCDRNSCTTLDTFLVLFCECVVSTAHLPTPIAVSTQCCCADLTAGVVAEVIPVEVEDTVVVHMDHFMDHGMLLMLFAKESVLAEEDTMVL